MASIKDRFTKKTKLGSGSKLGGRTSSLKSKQSGGSSIRNKFKRREQSVLDKAYESRNERSKGGSGGRTVFNHEIMNKYGIEDFSPTHGDHFIEIFPVSFDPGEPYFKEVSVHFGVGISNDAFICMQRYAQKRCYRCEVQNKMYRDLETYTKDQAKKLYPTDRCCYLLWERTKELIDGEDPDYTLKLWAAPRTKVHSEIQEKARDKINRYTLDVSDLTENGDGRTIGFTVVKQGDFPDYKAFDLIQRNEPIPEEILEKVHKIISDAEEKGYKNAIEMFFSLPEQSDIMESMASEGDGPDEFDRPAKKEVEEGSSSKPQDSNEDPEKELINELNKIEEELFEISKNPLKWRKWLKENDYEDALDMDKAEAIQAIIDDMYEKSREK